MARGSGAIVNEEKQTKRELFFDLIGSERRRRGRRFRVFFLGFGRVYLCSVTMI